MEQKRAGAVWAAVLAPTIAVLPGLTARWAGGAGWLAPLAALPAAFGVRKLLRKLAGEQGLAKGVLDAAGRPLGYALTFIYIMWAAVLAAARIRRSGIGLSTALGAPVWLCPAGVAVMALWLARGEEGPFLRTGAVFARVLAAVLGGVLLLTLAQIREENLSIPWTGDVLPVLWTAVPTLGVLCYGVYGAFLQGEGRGGRWVVVGCVLLAALALAVTGNLGAELAARLEDPFLTLSRQVGVKGAFQRIEALICALLVLGDLALVGMLLCACRALVGAVWSAKVGRWAMRAVRSAALGMALTVFRDGTAARGFEWYIAPWGNLVLAVAVPAALLWKKWLQRTR